MAFPLIFSIFTSVKTNTKSMETFTIRAYGRTELAQFYQAAGCHPRSRVYMPVHVRMIVEAIGEP